MVKKTLIFILLTILYTACQNKMEKQFLGNWSIDKYYGDFVIQTNYFCLNNDNTCELPLSTMKDRYTEQEKGSWKIISKEDSYFLEIISANKNFENIYKITDFRKVQDPLSLGNLQIMTLIGEKDSVVLFCRKALYE